RLPSHRKTVPSSSDLGDQHASIQILLEEPYRLEFVVAPEDQPHRLRFRLIDNQTTIAFQVADRYEAAHPDALLLRRRDLVADPLPGHLAFELRERQQHVE